MPPKQQKPMPFTMLSRLLKAMSREYTLQSLFKYGYRNKEDISNLPPETLVIGSQNVLTNAAELVGIRQGYTLDGAAGNQNNYGIDSAYDFLARTGQVENLRKWGPNMELRYVNPVSSVVSWINILNNLNVTSPVNFTNFFDLVTEVKMFCLMVNGGNGLIEWSGGVGSYASSSASQSGVISAIATAPVAGGNSYSVGDLLFLGGGVGGQAVVTGTTTSGTGAGSGGIITSVLLQIPGSGYTGSTTVPTTTNSASGGTGATISITSVVTGATITLSGSNTTDQLGFYSASANSGKFNLYIDGVTYTYTHAYGNTFYGVSAQPTATVGDAVIQVPFAVQASSVSGLPTNFTFDLISTLANQIWYGSLKSTNVYVSKTNNYLDTTFSSPRLPAEGALITLDAPMVGFSPQASNMYMTAGRDQWWISQTDQQTVTETSGANQIPIATESLFAVRLKTAFNQAAQSQALITYYKNSLVFVSNETIINALGLVKDIYSDPQVTNISDPIKYDIDAYDFAGGSVDYDNYYIYVAIPVQGIVRMYNVQKQYWEAPQTIPVSRFYHPTSVLGSTSYGHSSLTNESYQLFTGYNDNGNPINAVFAFPYVSSVGGMPWQKKSFNKVYTEGYISSNTSLMLTLNYDFGGFSGTYTTLISGSDLNIIFNKITDGSIGRNSLGTEPVGAILNIPPLSANPKFRIINTMPRVDCYEYQIVLSSDDVDFQWAVLRNGPAVSSSNNLQAEISE